MIQNIINNYSEYGITREFIESRIGSGLAEGFTYDFIYLNLKAELSQLTGEEFFCTAEDMAKALNMPVEEMDRIIEEGRKELIAAGENPDEYFQTVESTRFIV